MDTTRFEDALARLRDDPRVAAVLVALVGVAALFALEARDGLAAGVPTAPRGAEAAAQDAPGAAQAIGATAGSSGRSGGGSGGSAVAQAGPGSTDPSVQGAGGAGEAGHATSADGSPTVDPTTTTATVVIHVVGAVRRAGVVSLPADARVEDAIAAVGGAGPRADLARLNLAAHLVDGVRIEVPRRGRPLQPAVADPAATLPGAAGVGGAAGSGAVPSPEAPLSLNAASAAQLELLPGIGPSLAAAIVEERDRLGGFSSVDDLKRVRGIGEQRFADLRELVTL